MPGLSFIYSLKNELQLTEAVFIHALEELIHGENYKSDIIFDDPTFWLGCTKYPEYPIHIIENDDYFFVLEGQIYGKNPAQIEKELLDVAEWVTAEAMYNKRLVEWQLNIDGEFVLMFLHKKRRFFYILNDALGHLPLYYALDEKQLLVSREMSFIISQINDDKFDKMALAQYLVFRYPLKERTLWENISRLPPMSLIKIDLTARQVEIANLHTFNFENDLHQQHTLEENVVRLIELHGQACKNRDQSDNGITNVLSLSGGLDSRLVIASLNRCNIAYTSVTYLDFLKKATADVDVAQKIARCLNVKWKLFELPPPRGKDALALLRIKNGMNYLGMTFIIPFLSQLRDYYGSHINYTTGDSGLNMRGFLIPLWIRNIDDLIDFILSNHSRFSLTEAARLLALNPNDIRHELKNCLQSFPEKQLQGKYLHFVIYGRTLTWHYEGMDRNRSFFWLSAPLEATPFFVEAMKFPQSQKENFKLYQAVLKKLSPELSAIADANTNLSPDSCGYRVRQFIEQTLLHQLSRFPQLTLKLKRILKKDPSYDPSSAIIKCLQEQIRTCPAIIDYFSHHDIEKLTINCQQYSQGNMDILFTLTSIIESVTSQTSSLENYMDMDLK